MNKPKNNLTQSSLFALNQNKAAKQKRKKMLCHQQTAVSQFESQRRKKVEVDTLVNVSLGET